MPRVKKSTLVCIQYHTKTLIMTRFSKRLPRFTKKSPRQPARARVTGRTTPQCSLFGDSLQPFTDKGSLAYKHKNDGVNNNISLCVTRVDMTHFVTVRANTCARVTRVQHFVILCWDCYSVYYTACYATLKVMNASR